MENNNLKTSPVVSVITVCYNAGETMEKTLLSIMDQTYDNIELVIKDGGSSDNTRDIISKIIKQYPSRCVIFESSADSGIYDAMNRGVEISSGQWLIFINAGDEFYKNDVIEKVINKSHGKHADVLFGDAIVRDNWGEGIWKANLDVITKKMPFCHQACLVQKKCLMENMYDIRFIIGADYNLLLSLFKENKIFYYCDEIISVFDLNGISSTDYLANLNEQITIRIAQGYLPSQYWKSIEYFRKKALAIIKKKIDKYCPGFLYGFLRNIYKKYFKKYESFK